MASYQDSAIVLGRLDYSETSQILVLFTRSRGKIRVIAKGIKRGTKNRAAAPADLLDIGHVTLAIHDERSDSLANLTEWKQTHGLTALREKLSRIHAGQYVGEITALLTVEADPHPALFDALGATLSVISESDEPLALVVRYQMILLDAIGSLPRFDSCVKCDSVQGLKYFSSFEGGMICKSCEPGVSEKREVSAATLEALQTQGLSSRPFALLNYHVSHLAGRPPRTAAPLAPRSAPKSK